MEPEPYFSSPNSHCLTRWWSKATVAVVTGGNKGIGFAVVKRLAELGVTVVLTARDREKGEAAVEALRAQGLVDVHFLLLDVSDPLSISSFAFSFQAAFGALDILVNNAAVSFHDLVPHPHHSNSNMQMQYLNPRHAETVINTNFYGPKFLIQALLPVFRRSSSLTRILNVSSRLGSLNVRDAELRRVLERENLSEEEIERTVKLFLEDVRNGTWNTRGWPLYWTDYAVSKLALNAYSRVLAKRYQDCGLISVNCFCPGFTRTSMTNGNGTHTPDHAASLAATLALLPPQLLPTGKFFFLKSPSYNQQLLTSTSKL